MTEDLRTFKTFNDIELAEGLADVLEKHNISSVIEEDVLNFDPSYANHPLNKDYRLKIRQEDFQKANKALQEFYKTELDNVAPDYYLFDFSDEELMDIISKPDEWGEFDFLLAQQILDKKGKTITQERIEKLKQERIREVAQPEKTDNSLIITGYITAVFFPPAGIFIGLLMAYSKKTLPDGNIVYTYNKIQTKHGEIIWVIASVFMGLNLIGAFSKGKAIWFIS